MTNKEALEVFRKSDACYGDGCPEDMYACVDCPNNNTEEEFLDAMDLAKKALEDTIPKFHLQCLLCKGDVGVYSTHTMEQVDYTKYSYCEGCLRKGLKLLKAGKPEEIRIGDEVANHGTKGIVYIVDEGDVIGVVESKDVFDTFIWEAKDVTKTGRHFDEVEAMIGKYGEDEP